MDGVIQLETYHIQLILHILVCKSTEEGLWSLNHVKGNKKLCPCVHCTC